MFNIYFRPAVFKYEIHLKSPIYNRDTLNKDTIKEMDKYDKMGAFYDMMLIRDKRVGTRQSLNDDVIGVIFSYL